MNQVQEVSLATQLRAKRTEMMTSEVEAVALRLFDEHGFDEITVDDIAAEAKISARTFYRYFPAKEDVLQVSIERRSDALRMALADSPVGQAPLHALRLGLTEVLAAEDPMKLRRWIAVIASTPSVVKSVLGGIQLKSHPVMAEFLGTRLGLAADAFVPTMLAAAVGGILQASLTTWYLRGGDLATTVSDGLQVLERGIATDPSRWFTEAGLG
jgi:TetR/AcrR family transcriptional regulator, regulator of mycofactocin system